MCTPIRKYAGTTLHSEAARGHLKSALEADAKLWEAWFDLGVLASKDGDDDVAVDAFGKALAHNPDHPPALIARAEAYRRTGHRKDARADYENVLKHAEEDDPNRKDAAVRLASLLSHGLVRRPAQVALGAAARLWPGLMSSVAFHTRVSDAALSRTMLASHP